MSAGPLGSRSLSVGDGPPVVVLHPLGADGAFWQPFAAALPGRRVVAVDLPGHGTSPVPAGPWTVEDAADAVRRHLASEPVVDVVGLSVGGLVALALALRNPERVRRLVLAAVAPTYPEEWRARWSERAALARADGLGSLVDPTLDLWLGPSGGRPEAAEAYVRAVLARTDPEGYAGACLALGRVDLAPRLADLAVPTLVLDGEHDTPLFRSGGDQVAATPAGATRQHVPGAWHASALHRPDEFAALVRAHLDEGAGS